MVNSIYSINSCFFLATPTKLLKLLSLYSNTRCWPSMGGRVVRSLNWREIVVIAMCQWYRNVCIFSNNFSNLWIRNLSTENFSSTRSREKKPLKIVLYSSVFFPRKQLHSTAKNTSNNSNVNWTNNGFCCP